MPRLPAAIALFLTFSSFHSGSAQVGSDFEPDTWVFGPRYDVSGEVEIWNPVMQKVRNGEPVIGGTIRGTDPRIYCAMASAGYDFTWVEMQHEALTWEQVSRLWLACPGPAVPGVRIPAEGEENIQKPADMGALVIAVPTVDSVEEAQRAVDWTYFPPIGRRSNGGGQGFTADMWGQVPGGYRATWNRNVFLIVMIETLEGVKNARAIARIPGVDALFAASGDLGNFSGYAEGDPEYEMLVTEIVEAAQEAGKTLCGPLRWMGTRPEFSCFQGGTEASNIRRGAQGEIEDAQRRVSPSGLTAPSEGSRALAELSAMCTDIVYEADCLAAVRSAVASVAGLTRAERDLLDRRLSLIVAANPARAAQIREIASGQGVEIQ